MADAALIRLGGELRRIREAAGLSGSELARAIGWSQSKVSRVETGRFGASLAELAELLDFYQVPEEVRAELLARTARREGLEGAWVVRAGGPPRRQAELGTIESRVHRLRQYQATAVPGLLQTSRYAQAVAEAMGFEDVPSIAERRGERQAAFHRREDVRYEVVLDARALMRWPGGDSVMIEQLEHLIDLEWPSLDLRVLPARGGAGALSMGGFLIYEFTESRPTVVLVESHSADLYLSSERDVTTYGDTFTRLQKDSLSPRASTAHLKRTLRDLRGGQKKG
jgi:transcriptional regulator with XRE-family HTH domain